MKLIFRNRVHDLIAILSGIILALSFAPYAIFPFGLVAPLVLLALWLNQSAKRAAFLGFLFGLGLFGAGVYWVFISINVYGDLPIPLSVFFTSGFIAILSLFTAFTGYITNRFFPLTTSSKLICAFPALWVLTEWMRTWLFTGFPWLFVGYSQTHSPLKGYAPILSVYGVSLAALVSSGLILNAILKIREKNYKWAYYNGFALLFIWLVGQLLCLITWTHPKGESITVSLVQGNIPQTLKWSPEHLQLSLDRYDDLSKPLWGKNKLIIWPEAAIPLPLPEASDYVDGLDEKASQTKTHLITGIPIKSTSQRGYYNAVITLGDAKNVYIKRRLVPFGEYTPFEKQVSGLFDFLKIPMSNMISGKSNQEPLTINNVKILTAVCYEVAYPELLLSRDPSIGLFLTVTNDAWFGHSSAQAQHLEMAQMRALESGRPLLFSSNDGITAIIGSTGQVLSQAPPYQPYVLTGTVQPTHGITPWQRFGMDPLLLILAGLIIVAIRSQLSEKRNGRSI